MPEVPKPDVYRRHDHLETPPPIGPRNLVVRWEVAPFHQLAHKLIGTNGENWIGEDVFVLSLWSEDGPEAPFRFCLSGDGAAQLSEGLAEEIRDVLGRGAETE